MGGNNKKKYLLNIIPWKAMWRIFQMYRRWFGALKHYLMQMRGNGLPDYVEILC